MIKVNRIFFFFLLAFTSCSTAKQLHQEKSIATSENSSLENTVSESQIFSVTKIVESKDTILLFPGSRLTVSAIFEELLEGDTIYATGDDLSLKTFYDSLTKTINTQATVMPKSIPVQFQKVTETRQVASGTVTTKKQEQHKQTLRTENKDRQVQRNSFPAWGILLLVITFFGLIGFLILKFRKGL
jgi:hypothetical protein